MQISAFQIQISLTINTDIFISLLLEILVIEIKISMFEMQISLIKIQISVIDIQIYFCSKYTYLHFN